MIRTTILMGVLALAGTMAAQPPDRGPRGWGGPAGLGGRFLGAEPGMPGRVVRNAPYSAEIVTERTQTLSDGNHIKQTNTVHVSRDSEGRTREEQSLQNLNGLTGNANLPQVVFIHDPVANAAYALNVNDKTATRSAFHRQGLTPAQAGQGPMARRALGPNALGGSGLSHPNAQNVKTEALGRQTIEGVQADGTRTTLTIPAGQMGNEQAIQVVTETWYSSDLQTVVMRKHSDPRSGETVTRMMNVSRVEPPQTLFTVPVDYKVTDQPRPGRGPIQKQ
jgi:hypothetical protein